jgi:Secretion system C-terminal sorting domain
MKHLSAVTLLPTLLGAPASAQFTNSDVVPSPGTQLVQHYCQFIYPNGGGVGTTEDFSGLVTDSTVTVNYMVPGSTPNGAQFPTADLAWADGNGNYTYYNVDDAVYEDIGWDLNGEVAVASDPETWAVFPLGYGTTWSDAHAISFTAGGITTSRSGTVFCQGDANNTTLLMPYGTETDVKRVFAYDSYTDDIGGFMTITYSFTYHFYYRAGAGHPLLIVQDLLITPSVGPSTHKIFSVYNEVSVGMDEPTTPAATLSLYPSPASDVVTVQLDRPNAGPLSLEITDATGALVRREDMGRAAAGVLRRPIDIGALRPGLYFLRLGSVPQRPAARLVVQR